MSWYLVFGTILVSAGSIIGFYGTQILSFERKRRLRKFIIGGSVLIVGTFSALMGGNIIGSEQNRIYKKNISPFIRENLADICIGGLGIRDFLYSEAYRRDIQINDIESVEFVFFPSPFDIFDLLDSLYLNNIYEEEGFEPRFSYGSTKKWFDRTKKIKASTEKNFDRIFNKSLYIDEELLKLLLEIEHSRFFFRIENELTGSQTLPEQNLVNFPKIMSGELIDYFDLLDKIEKDYLKMERKYIINRFKVSQWYNREK